MGTQHHQLQEALQGGANERRSREESRGFRTNAPKGESINGVPGRVLVVDDDRNARTILVELLREQGYAVETAADGVKALPKIEAFAPDLLLTDLEMPGMDGIELMLRAQRFDPTLSVIIATASVRIDTVVSAMRQGATDYLVKPLDLDKLTHCVEQAVEQRRRNAMSKTLG